MKYPAIICLLVACAVSSWAQDRYVPGVDVRVFELSRSPEVIPFLIEGQTPNFNTLEPVIDLTDFGVADWFYTEARARLWIESAGVYEFLLISDDGAILDIGGDLVIDHDGLHAPEPGETEAVRLEAGYQPLLIRHFEANNGQRLRLEWKRPGDSDFSLIPTENLSTPAGVVRVTSPGPKRTIDDSGPSASPGDIRPLDAVHPSYDLFTVRPEGFEPKVGGMDFLSDGRLVISRWDPEGGVYLLDGVHGNDRSAITAKRIAFGLAEPLGLSVIPAGDTLAPDGDRLFVLQKQELTELIDHDGDDVIDEYRTVCNAWPVSDNFHEFAFGLAYKDGKLYGALAIAINPGGASTQPQKPQRGRIVEIDPDTGAQRFLGRGLRTPNTVGIGLDGELFVCDNQGDWLPSSKLIHVDLEKPDAFWESRAALPPDWIEKPSTPPVLWMPQGEIGNSPSEPGAFPEHSPFAGQMLHAEVTHGGLKRDFLEKVDGRYQGAVLRFTQGLEAGINRFAVAPNGDLFVGGVGSGGNWSHKNKRFGLQRLRYNGITTFEMHAVRAKSNGFEIEFTKPLAEGVGHDAGDYFVQQWAYKPTEGYGGPKIDPHRLAVRSATVSLDRRRVFLEIAGLKPEHIVYFRLRRDRVTDDDSADLWSTEAWYTLNAIPTDQRGEIATGPVGPPKSDNFTPLTDAERGVGWRSLFDGRTTRGWRNYGQAEFPARGWVIDDATLHHTRQGGGGDITFDEIFGDFEFTCDWRIARGGNSGVFYRVDESNGKPAWHTGGEMQVLDDKLHHDGKNPATSAGALYGLIAAEGKQLQPVGEWNRIRIVAHGTRIEHWLNGQQVVAYDTADDSFRDLVAQSKFKDHSGFAQQSRGRIVLQDHGDAVWYRNLRIRPLQ